MPKLSQGDIPEVSRLQDMVLRGVVSVLKSEDTTGIQLACRLVEQMLTTSASTAQDEIEDYRRKWPSSEFRSSRCVRKHIFFYDVSHVRQHRNSASFHAERAQATIPHEDYSRRWR